EFRLNLRIDNADRRLTPIGRRVGLVSDSDWDNYLERQARLAASRDQIASTVIDTAHPFFATRELTFKERPQALALLRRPEIRLQQLIAEGVVSLPQLRREDVASIETDIKYEGYLRQQEREVQKLRKAESKRLPENLEYSTMPGLSREMVEKLSRIRPQSIAQASRIPGITPAAISILLFHLEIRKPQPETVA